MELENTTTLMMSKDYKERFKAEYYQLKIRYTKLMKMLKYWDKNELDFVPSCPRGLYTLQVRAMHDYLAVLQARAVIENIDLLEDNEREK